MPTSIVTYRALSKVLVYKSIAMLQFEVGPCKITKKVEGKDKACALKELVHMGDMTKIRVSASLFLQNSNKCAMHSSIPLIASNQ